MPTGLLVLHPDTGQIIAAGQSSLSTLLSALYLDGLQYNTLDHLRQVIRVRCKKKDLKSFRIVAPAYYQRAGLSVVEVVLRTPLSGFVPIDLKLRPAYDTENPFEKIQIGAYSP